MREMSRDFFERVHTENIVLDIGGDIGALMVYTDAHLRGKEIEVSPKARPTHRTHTAILERRIANRVTFVGVFPALQAGDYYLWGSTSIPVGEITIVGGGVAEVDGRGLIDVAAHASHPHPPDMCITPSKNGKGISAAPMASAPLRYTDDGQVAWDQMWTDFCDLALIGGPPHRGTLLEPAGPEVIKAAQDAYDKVVGEIERGLHLVTGLTTIRGSWPGQVGLRCQDEQMAVWMQEAIEAENISTQRNGDVLLLPAGPDFQLEKEIKNVITAVAKTHHYWTEHRWITLT